MTIFVRATAATRPASRVSFYATQVAAAALTAVVLAQLFTFEDFPSVLSAYLLPGGYPTAMVLAALLVTAEVLAVPVFLMMRLSPLMRAFSLFCGISSSVIWLVLACQLFLQGDMAMNSGLFGATLPVHGGGLPLLFAVSLVPGLIIELRLLLRRLAQRR